MDDKVKFNDIGSIVAIEVDCERFHNNFRLGFWTHLLRYKGFGFGIVFTQQRNARERKMVKVQLAKHVIVKLQPSIQ
jgi:hypothetical protein